MAGQELDIEAIVREVLRRLQELADSGAQPGGDGAVTEKQPPAVPVTPEAAHQPGQLRLTVRYGLDGSLSLGEKPVSVKQGQYLTVEWPWEVPKDH